MTSAVHLGAEALLKRCLEGFRNEFEHANWLIKHQSEIDALPNGIRKAIMHAHAQAIAKVETGPRERGLLFSSPLVRAILREANPKTQTRRTKALDKLSSSAQFQMVSHDSFQFYDEHGEKENCFIKCPYGVPGDRLWVRETWRAAKHGPAAVDGVFYKSDGSFQQIENTASAAEKWVDAYDNGKHGAHWRPSLFMPRWASRITLEIEDVRVERLQDITEADARTEGFAAWSKDGSLVKYGLADSDGLPGSDDPGSWAWAEWEKEARRAYLKLWDQINGRTATAAKNPFVWALTFRRLMPGDVLHVPIGGGQEVRGRRDVLEAAGVDTSKGKLSLEEGGDPAFGGRKKP